MNFKPDLAAKVMDGSKTVTRRLASDNPRSPWWREQCHYRHAQSVAICPGRGKHAIGRAAIVSIERMRLGRPSDQEARREGFADAAEFVEAWRTINGTYDENAMVWRIGLRAHL